jgi:FlaA1/EpsC-like NDP-sugar epimerase
LNWDSYSWHELLIGDARQPVDLKSSELRGVLTGKSVLITGAGGWIGSRLVKRLAESDADKLILLDSSESALHEIDQTLRTQRGNTAHVAVLTSVSDVAAMDEVFDRHRPEIVYHAGALKHVPLMESNPIAVVETNTIGTFVLMEMARGYGCEQVIMVSTDKAVDPASIMGASKRMAELVVLAMAGGTLRKQVVRLGNVLGSSGSVMPLFLRQIASGGPVTVCHSEVRRFFMRSSDAVEALLDALSPACPEGLLVAAAGDPIRIVDLANFLIDQNAKIAGGPDLIGRKKMERISVAFTTLRPGDKMEEALISGRESYIGKASGLLREAYTPLPPRQQLEDGIKALKLAVQRRNFGDLLQTVLQLVPEYQPGPLILNQVNSASTAGIVQ